MLLATALPAWSRRIETLRMGRKGADMQVERELGKYQLVPLVFMQSGVADSQTDVQLYVCEVAAAAGIAVDGYTMPFAGYVVGVSYGLSAAATAGTLTIGPTIGGAECADPTLTVTTGAAGSDTCQRALNPFAKNARIGVQITTSADWNGTGADLVVTVWVVLAISGI